MVNLDAIIKVIKKMYVDDRDFKTSVSHEEIINHTLEQQGVHKVLKVLEDINNNEGNIAEYLKEAGG